MALSLTPTNSSCFYARVNTSRSVHADRSGCLHTGKRNVNISSNKEVPRSLSWRSNGTPNRARVIMMSFPVPRVLYESAEEGISGFIDLPDVLEKNRIIMIGDAINEEIANKLLATLLYLDGLDPSKDLLFFINCLGGDIPSSLAIYDTMQSLKSPVVTRCLGYAYDISGFILAAGKKGNRAALPRSRIILRSPVGEANGQVDGVVNEARELTRIRDYLYSQLAKHTNQSVEKIFDDLSDSKSFNARQALEYGIIDRIPRPARLSSTMGNKEKTAPGLG